jgi:hypothetical protein
MGHRIFTTSFASVYPAYVNKLERKGRTRAELDEVIEWLTGFDEQVLGSHLAEGTTFEDFFARAHLNPNVSAIKGTVCGVRVEEVEDPLMQQIRYLDKLVDELAKGKSMDKVLRSGPSEHAVGARAELLPEELAAGSDDPELQARAILAESEERTEQPERTREESTQTPDEM